MLRFFHKYQSWILSILRILLYGLILYIAGNDPDASHRWIVFGLYTFLIGSIFLTYVLDSPSTGILKIARSEWLWFLGLLVVATGISFFALQDYPFVSVHDELRDSGLFAAKVISGELRHFFDYGAYNGFGNIIPVIASFFYRIFGASVYTYRIPAALVAIADVGLLYILIRQLTNKVSVSLIASLAYAALALHMFYARTELVVIFDSFWATALLLVFYLWFKKGRTIDFILLGTTLGAAANFHSSVRIIALILLVLALLIEVKRVLFNKAKMTLGIFALIVYCLIGFGPTVLYNNSNKFFQGDKFDSSTLASKESLLSGENLMQLKANYAKSLMVWFYEPAISHYKGATPLLPPLFGLLFLAGIGYTIFVAKKPFLYILLGLVFLLPFTNSTITNWVNADHRLMPLLPLGGIFIALGLAGVQELFKESLIKYVIFVIFIANIGFQVFSFFYFQPAVKDYDVKAFLSMNVLYQLQSITPESLALINPDRQGVNPQDICLSVSQNNASNLDLLHYKEQYQYFVPNAHISVIGAQDMPDNKAYIYQGTCPSYPSIPERKKIVVCPNNNMYQCPIGYKGEIEVRY